MYTTVREFYKYNYEHGETDMTFKEWDSLDKAIAYAERYAKGLKFVAVTVEDENGNVLYEIVDHGAVVNDYRKEIGTEKETKEGENKMITVINNINEIKGMGEYYIQEGDKKLRIDCKAELIKIYDLSAGMVYRKEVKEWDSYPSFREVARKVTNCRELVEYLAFQSDFEFREMDRNEIFNPFFKELTGELQIKSKNGRFTKAQVKKILKHKDTEIVRDAVYTDDYAYDAQYDFQNGVVIDKLSMLEEVESYFNGSTTIRGGEFKIYTYGNSNVTLIKNKNIKVVA